MPFAGLPVLALDPPPEAPVPPDAVSVTDFGAKGDGRTDDTKAVQSAIDSIPEAGGVVYVPVGVYRTTAPIQLRPQLRLLGSTRRSWGDGPDALGCRFLIDHEGHGLMLEFDKPTGGIITVVNQGLVIENEGAVFPTIVGNQFHGLRGEDSVAIDIRSPTASQVVVSGNTILGFRTGIRDRGAGMNVIHGNIIDTQEKEGTGIDMNPAEGARPSVVSANVIVAGRAGIARHGNDRSIYTGNSMTDLEGQPYP
jgi:hypothetical protein